MKRKPQLDENVEMCRRIRAEFDSQFKSFDEMFDFLMEQDRLRRRAEGRSTRVRKSVTVQKSSKARKPANKR
jgi:hypothetical protein